MNVGVDEAGRGSMFGPVVAAAVIWDPSITHIWLKDSKKLSKTQRKTMFHFVKENCIDYGIGFANESEIDELNILQATQLAMHRALDNINLLFDQIQVDGNYFKPWKNVCFECIIKGDQFNSNISAASILAKETRDKFIEKLTNENKTLDVYDLTNNKGYLTKTHMKAIKENGVSKFHRQTFSLKNIY
tara:strand:- start:564 stop:1127 length:564 start_codon:yes stop_codon:yes gene_type:complete